MFRAFRYTSIINHVNRTAENTALLIPNRRSDNDFHCDIQNSRLETKNKRSLKLHRRGTKISSHHYTPHESSAERGGGDEGKTNAHARAHVPGHQALHRGRRTKRFASAAAAFRPRMHIYYALPGFIRGAAISDALQRDYSFARLMMIAKRLELTFDSSLLRVRSLMAVFSQVARGWQRGSHAGGFVFDEQRGSEGWLEKTGVFWSLLIFAAEFYGRAIGFGMYTEWCLVREEKIASFGGISMGVGIG